MSALISLHYYKSILTFSKGNENDKILKVSGGGHCRVKLSENHQVTRSDFEPCAIFSQVRSDKGCDAFLVERSIEGWHLVTILEDEDALIFLPGFYHGGTANPVFHGDAWATVVPSDKSEIERLSGGDDERLARGRSRSIGESRKDLFERAGAPSQCPCEEWTVASAQRGAKDANLGDEVSLRFDFLFFLIDIYQVGDLNDGDDNPPVEIDVRIGPHKKGLGFEKA